MAVMLCAPMVSALVLRLAVPLARGPVPKTVAPSLKVMLPVADVGERLAVRVRLWPNCRELALAASVSALVDCVIVTDCALLVALLVFVSPA